MKLIDVLNMISKGEIEIGFRMKHDDEIYTYRLANENEIYPDFYTEQEDNCENGLFVLHYVSAILNDEVEIIPPDHIGEVDKKVEHSPTQMSETQKIDLLDKEMWDNIFIEEKLDLLFNQINLIAERVNKI